MRTTLDIADDVLQAVKELARRHKKTAGQVISELARAAMTQASVGSAGEPVQGLRPFARPDGCLVTDEVVDQLREDGPY